MRESRQSPPFTKHFEDSFLQSAFFVYIPCGPPATHSAKGLKFPRLAKVVSRMVCCLRASRKSFRKGFDISALGESFFPNGLAFPRIANVISRIVCDFRVWRKSLPEWFDVSAYGESYFQKGLGICLSYIYIKTDLCFI